MIKEIATTLTQRSQVTVPAEVVRLLGLKPRGRVVFTIDDGKVYLAPAPFTLESAYRSVKHAGGPADWESVTRAAKDAKAEETVRKLTGG